MKHKHSGIEQLQTDLAKKILILDGAMSTMIQRFNLLEDDCRGTRFVHL